MHTSSRFASTSLVILFAATILTPAIASAHATGASWEVAAGRYTLDIGYDPVVFTAGQYTRFDFSLWIGKTTTDSNGITGGDPEPFDQILTSVVDNDTHATIFTTKIWDQPIGPTTLLYEFVEPGNYSLDLTFLDAQGNTIVTHDFPITVEPSGGTDYGSYAFDALALLLGCAVGIGVVLLLRKRVI